MSVLAANFVASGPQTNFVLPWEDVTFKFTNPPKTASNVQVKVLENVSFLDGTEEVKYRFVGGFLGNITSGKYVVDRLFGMPLPPEPDPACYSIVHPEGRSRGHILGFMPGPERVLSHTLLLRIEGVVQGNHVRFRGTHPLHAEYPLAMIIPDGKTTADFGLRVVASWCEQWRKHKPDYRKTFKVPVSRGTGPIKPREYDALIQAFADAAAYATSGVVALATGHGDADGTAWCALSPEGKPRRRLRINFNELKDGVGILRSPGTNTKVKLNALDRMADAAANTPIRRFLIHTCRVGANKDFIQMMADRLRVPVFGHIERIEYVGFPGSGTITAAYAGKFPKKPVIPRAYRQWPIRKLGTLMRPTSPPPKKWKLSP